MKPLMADPVRMGALSLGLSAFLGTSASALTVTGTVTGHLLPNTRLGGFVVNAFGQPVQEIFNVPLSGGKFEVNLPASAPNAKALVNIDERLTWPGLIFQKTSMPAQAAELKVYVYRDGNQNNQRDDNEGLREVRLGAGKAEVFIVWASSDVTVNGDGGYQAILKKGWNAMTVEFRTPIKVQPLSESPVQINLGK